MFKTVEITRVWILDLDFIKRNPLAAKVELQEFY